MIVAQPGFGQALADLARGLVHRVARRDPSRAEDRHRRADLGQRVEAGHELAHDPQHAPGIAVGEGRRTIAQLLVPREEQTVFGRLAGARSDIDRRVGISGSRLLVLAPLDFRLLGLCLAFRRAFSRSGRHCLKEPWQDY